MRPRAPSPLAAGNRDPCISGRISTALRRWRVRLAPPSPPTALRRDPPHRRSSRRTPAPPGSAGGGPLLVDGVARRPCRSARSCRLDLGRMIRPGAAPPADGTRTTRTPGSRRTPRAGRSKFATLLTTNVDLAGPERVEQALPLADRRLAGDEVGVDVLREARAGWSRYWPMTSTWSSCCATSRSTTRFFPAAVAAGQYLSSGSAVA